MVKYYKWMFCYWFCDKFSGTFIDRIFFIFTNSFLSPPTDQLFPMKYNKKTEEFDKFYSWKEIKMVANSFKIQNRTTVS